MMEAEREHKMERSSDKGFDYNSVKPRIVLEDEPIDYFNSPPKEFKVEPKEVKVEEFPPVSETDGTSEHREDQVESSSSAKSTEEEGVELEQWLPELLRRGEEQRRQCWRIFALCRAWREVAAEREGGHLGAVLASLVASGEWADLPHLASRAWPAGVHELCEALAHPPLTRCGAPGRRWQGTESC